MTISIIFVSFFVFFFFKLNHNALFSTIDPGMYKAVYAQTTRGKDQLLFCGQPFIYEKSIRLPNDQLKKLWRCNQWYAI